MVVAHYIGGIQMLRLGGKISSHCEKIRSSPEERKTMK